VNRHEMLFIKNHFSALMVSICMFIPWFCN